MAFDEFNTVMCGTRPPKQSRTSPALPQVSETVYPPVPAANALALNWAPTLCLPIADQGACGNLVLQLICEMVLIHFHFSGCCWSFAAVAIIESMIKKQINGGFFTPLSAQQLIDCSKESPNNGCNGGW